jgi:hypothetical protein
VTRVVHFLPFPNGIPLLSSTFQIAIYFTHSFPLLAKLSSDLRKSLFKSRFHSIASSKFQPHVGRATTPLRQGSLALSARAVTMVMAARSDVPVKSVRHFQVVVVFVYFPTRTRVYSFAILNRSEWGKCGPQARRLINGGRASSWCSYPATATTKIDR